MDTCPGLSTFLFTVLFTVLFTIFLAVFAIFFLVSQMAIWTPHHCIYTCLTLLDHVMSCTCAWLDSMMKKARFNLRSAQHLNMRSLHSSWPCSVAAGPLHSRTLHSYHRLPSCPVAVLSGETKSVSSRWASIIMQTHVDKSPGFMQTPGHRQLTNDFSTRNKDSL